MASNLTPEGILRKATAHSRPALFRIGGVYRQRNGVVTRLVPFKDDESLAIAYIMEYASPTLNAGGLRRLSDGFHVRTGTHDRDPEIDLIPSELQRVNGEWVPIAPASKTPTLDKLEAQCARRQSDERRRAPLAYFYRQTKFDPFPGYIVDGPGIEPAAPRRAEQHSPDLAAPIPLHGSAHLLGGGK